MVRVFAHAAYGLKRSAKLLTELNDIQHRLLSASIAYDDGVVVLTQTISPEGLYPTCPRAGDESRRRSGG